MVGWIFVVIVVVVVFVGVVVLVFLICKIIRFDFILFPPRTAI